jgi:PAS domain S-box-containing protein
MSLRGHRPLTGKRAIAAFGAGLLTLGLAVAVRWVLDPVLDDALPLITIYAAIAVTVWLGGLRVALPIAALGWMAMSYLFIAPRDTMAVEAEALAATFGGYLFTSMLILGLGTVSQRAWHRAARNRRELADFVESANVGIHGVGPDGTILWANRAELDMLGYRRDEYVGRNIAEFHLDTSAVEHILASLARADPVYEYPARMRARDGSVRHVVINSSALFDRGRFVQSRCFTRDVTEEKLVDEARALLAAIVESTDDAIVSKSLDGIILSWNSGAERVFGYRAAEVIGLPITTIMPPELYHEEHSIIERLRSGRKIETYETVRLTKDGRRVDVALTISPVFDRNGRIIAASKVARDITSRKQVERALRESERHVREVLEALPAAVYTTDAQGVITHFNRAAVDLCGRVPQIGADHWRVARTLYRVDGTPLPDHQDPMAVSLEEDRPVYEPELIVERPNGDRAWVAAYPRPLRSSDGALVGGINMLVDITERKRAEEAVREQTRVAEALNRVGSALVAELDPQRIVQLVTDEATALTTARFGAFFYNDVNENGETYQLYTVSGVPRAAFDALPMPRNTEIFGPTFRGEGVVRSDDVKQDPRFGRNAPHHGMPEGHLPVTSYLAVPVVSRSGKVLGGLFFGHPEPGRFTERHERLVGGIAAQAAVAIDNAMLYARVQESEQRFRQLAENVDHVFWMADAQAPKILYVSPAYEDIWGRSVDSLYRESSSFVDAIHPDDRDRVIDAMARQRGGETTVEEYRLVQPSGALRWIWDRAFPIRDETGRVIRIAGFAADITERKVAEARLLDSEERYRRLTELLPVGVYTCSAPEGTITYFNEKAAELWGRAPEAGERFCGSIELLLPDGTHLPHEACPMGVALREGRGFRNEEVQIRRSDGSRITVLVNIEPIRDAQGRVVSAINVLNDVSTLKRAEHQLKEADRRKDEFLATLAHELRNPLAPVSYALEFIRSTTNDNPSLREPLEMMHRQINHMGRLIDDLLDVSRITRNKLELRQDVIELAGVIDLAVETCRPLIEARQHDLLVKLPELPVHLHADAVRLAQAFSNLLSNACKYTEERGTIRLNAERRGDEVVVSVQDTGIGIPPDRLDHIFELFTQAHAAREQSLGGLGIGLTLVRRLIEMHGGSVQALSPGPGRGSEFIVTLPVLEYAGVCESDNSSLTMDGARHFRRVLVVDDNVDAAHSLCMLLDMSGHQTQLAHDGLAAIEAVERFRPDVVLLDIGLPKMNGYEVCRRIRQQPRGREIVVIAITGWGQQEDRLKSQQAGFDLHLVKPVGLDALDQALAAVAEL